ncbi:MAG TPA: MFS transporter [Trebonia sp.]
MFGSLRIRNYRLFCIGRLFANTGQWTQRVARDWLVLSITGNTTDVGITVALQFIPSLSFGLPGGLIADRYPKRRILQVTQSGMALVGALLTATGWPRLRWVVGAGLGVASGWPWCVARLFSCAGPPHAD